MQQKLGKTRAWRGKVRDWGVRECKIVRKPNAAVRVALIARVLPPPGVSYV